MRKASRFTPRLPRRPFRPIKWVIINDLWYKGTKRATASLAQSYTEETLPRVGGLVVVLDGQGRPRCVWRTTEITVKPLNQVDAAFARDEGEGDRSLATWLANHRRHFGIVCAAKGWTMSDDIAVVFERFEIVYRGEEP